MWTDERLEAPSETATFDERGSDLYDVAAAWTAAGGFYVDGNETAVREAGFAEHAAVLAFPDSADALRRLHPHNASTGERAPARCRRAFEHVA